MPNNNMYVNANEVLELLECMQEANINNVVVETLHEVQEMILDLKWREIK